MTALLVAAVWLAGALVVLGLRRSAAMGDAALAAGDRPVSPPER